MAQPEARCHAAGARSARVSERGRASQPRGNTSPRPLVRHHMTPHMIVNLDDQAFGAVQSHGCVVARLPDIGALPDAPMLAAGLPTSSSRRLQRSASRPTVVILLSVGSLGPGFAESTACHTASAPVARRLVARQPSRDRLTPAISSASHDPEMKRSQARLTTYWNNEDPPGTGEAWSGSNDRTTLSSPCLLTSSWSTFTNLPPCSLRNIDAGRSDNNYHMSYHTIAQTHYTPLLHHRKHLTCMITTRLWTYHQ